MELVKKIYIYMFSAIGLVLMIFGCVQLINLGLRAYVFTQADIVYPYPATPQSEMVEKGVVTVDPEKQRIYEEYTRTSTRQRQAANAVALLIVGTPLFFYHWNKARKEK